MKKGLLILSIIFILSSMVNAIGISPDMTHIKFEPLKEDSFVVRVINTEDRPLNASIRLEGEMAKYFIPEPKSIIVTPLTSTPIIISYALPYTTENPGPNQIVINTLENIPNSGGVTATLNVLSKIILDVPYPHKYLEYAFNVKNINLEENLAMKFSVFSKGEENIFAIKPTVNIYPTNDLNNLVKTYEANSFALNSGAEKYIEIKATGTEVSTGTFTAEAYIVYDGLKSKETLQNFTIGYKDVEIVNYSKKILSGGIREFKVILENKWNNLIDDVYVVAHLEKDEVPVSEKSFSHTITIGALETAEMPVFIDIGDINPGEYKVYLELYYGGLKKEEKLDVSVGNGFEITTEMAIAGVIMLLVILDIGWMIFERKTIKYQKEDKSEEKMKNLSRK